ncbi:MAG: hypothetical protein LC749_05235 [Actinobacteria bacterium]|nr:hypothetical protein [Actinomycetota bacterium]
MSSQSQDQLEAHLGEPVDRVPLQIRARCSAGPIVVDDPGPSSSALSWWQRCCGRQIY